MLSRIIAIALTFTFGLVQAQTVDITTMGVGSTPSHAETVALRSALEQCYGVFLAAKSELSETSTTTDGKTEHMSTLFENMATITSGEIVSYEVLEQTEESIQGQPSRFIVVVKSRVSVEAVANYVRSKGVEVQVAGGMFTQNIKLRQLNEEAEITALENLVDQAALMLNNCVDFEVQYTAPTEHVDDLWLLKLATFSKWNQNFEDCLDFIASSLRKIACSEQEAQERISANESHYNLQIERHGEQHDLTFRSAEGIFSLGDLLLLLRMATMNFNVAIGDQSIDGPTAWDNCLYRRAFNGAVASCNSGLRGSRKLGESSNSPYVDLDYPLVGWNKSFPVGFNRIPRENPRWTSKPLSTRYFMRSASKSGSEGFKFEYSYFISLSEIKKNKGNLTQSASGVFNTLLDRGCCLVYNPGGRYNQQNHPGYIRWNFDELAKNSVPAGKSSSPSPLVDSVEEFDACLVFEFPLFFTLEELEQIESIKISPARLLE